MTRKFWTSEELDRLKDLYPSTSNKEIKAAFPDRSQASIHGMANKLNIHKIVNSWSNKELELLKKYYPNSSNEYIQEQLLKECSSIRTLHSINNNAKLLALKKTGRKKFSINIIFEERSKLVSDGKNFCNSCHIIKDISHFERTEKMTLGYKNDCLDCRSLKQKKNKENKQPNVECGMCNKPFFKDKTNLSRDKNHFCSEECNKEWRSIQMASNNINNPKYSITEKKEVISLLNQGFAYSEIVEKTSLTFPQVFSIRKNNNIEYIGKNKYKSELHRKLQNLLKQMFPNNNLINEYYIKETRQFFDIYDFDSHIAYEANGIQHYIQESTWNRSDEAWELQQERDRRKIDYCKKKDIPLVIVRYDEDVTEELIVFKLKELGINYEDVIKSSSFLLPTEEGDFAETKTVVNI